MPSIRSSKSTLPVGLGEDRTRVGIPLRQARAALDLVAFVDMQAGAVRNLVGRQFLARLVDDDDRHRPAHGDELAGAVLGDRAVLDLHRAVEVRLDERLVDEVGRAADVERAHRQLRARLTDRLRGDDADSLADVDGRTASKVAAVALAANALLRLARQHRADADFLHLRLLDRLGMTLFDQFAGLDDDLGVLALGAGDDDVLLRRTAKNTRAERHDHLTGVDDRLHVDAGVGAAILFRDDGVLRDVDETARQVARVRRLQGGVGQTLTGAVGGVEVLQNRQAFLEVRDDRRLDDFARGLRHQAAHTGELLHLRWRTTRTGVAHHVDRVDLQIAAGLVLLDRGNAVHHLLGDLVGALRPGVDDLVVLLEARDQAVLILLLELAHEVVRGLDDLRLGVGDHHVVLAERDAGLERVVEAQLHDAVAEDHRLLLTAVTVDGVDHSRDRLLRQQLVDERELHARLTRQHFAQDHAARRRVVDFDDLVALRIERAEAALDLGVQGHGAGFERVTRPRRPSRTSCPRPAPSRAGSRGSRGRARYPATAR